MRGCLFSLQNSHGLMRTAHGFRPWPGAGEALPGRASFRLDASFLHNVFEARGISLNARVEIGDAHWRRIGAADCEKALDVGRYQDSLNLIMQLLNDGLGHILGSK